jgi:hypothetical protein
VLLFGNAPLAQRILIHEVGNPLLLGNQRGELCFAVCVQLGKLALMMLEEDNDALRVSVAEYLKAIVAGFTIAAD